MIFIQVVVEVPMCLICNESLTMIQVDLRTSPSVLLLLSLERFLLAFSIYLSYCAYYGHLVVQ